MKDSSLERKNNVASIIMALGIILVLCSLFFICGFFGSAMTGALNHLADDPNLMNEFYGVVILGLVGLLMGTGGLIRLLLNGKAHRRAATTGSPSGLSANRDDRAMAIEMSLPKAPQQNTKEIQEVATTERSGCLTLLLLFNMLSPLLLLYLSLGNRFPQFELYLSLSVLRGIFAFATWKWKRWGIYGIVVLALINLILNLIQLDVPNTITSFLFLLLFIYLVRRDWLSFKSHDNASPKSNSQ